VVIPGKWKSNSNSSWGWNKLEGFTETTTQTERQSTITDIFADSEDATRHAKPFYDSLN